MSLTQSVNQLAVRGRKAALRLLRAKKSLDPRTRRTFFKLFDTQVQPVLLYAAEVWGLYFDISPAENIHTRVCKRFLGVTDRTADVMDYRELGRYPLHVNSYIRVIQFWLRIIKFDFDRLAKQAYMMLKRMDENG
ncbi:hypothetical protein BaRGS_00031218 [Batillaria attramentaria]|uniref:Uncharacterized protein n=1 Tax=Batillaria attramentaria TaxID=370345 RepID=A0ABD0JR07_9CAEN